MEINIFRFKLVYRRNDLGCKFWADLEKVYEQGMDRQAFNGYQSFKSVVKSIGEERKLGREFEELSGYSLYHAVKHAKASQAKKINVKSFMGH